MKDNRKYIALGCIFAAAIALGCAAKGTVPPAAESTAGNTGAMASTASALVKAMMPETGTGVKLIRSDEWAEKYPNEYKTYIQNDENSEVTDYIEENPYIKTLYEGYGFAISYGSARGHTYVLTDVTETGRPHKLANCFTCKTSDLTAAVLRDGDSAYSMAFEDMEVQVTDAFGCFHCHENTPGTMYVTHPYVTKALGDDISKVDARTLSCAQCHTEYYFDPATKATTVSYQGLGKMSPEDSLAYENALKDSEGNMFADWVDEDTGVRKLKVQHPEFETFMGEGSAHKSFLTCADCHMEKAAAEDGSTYTSHYWVSPLASESIQKNTCASCHQDGVESLVKSIQKATRDRENELGNALEKLDKDLAAAVAAGSLSDADLEAARLASRNAQFFWDYVFVENSEGAHNSKLTNHCLDLAQQYLDEANSYLS